MTDWQKRVLAERDELNEKIRKIDAFLNDPEKIAMTELEDQRLLSSQRYYMQCYYQMLKLRIERFK